MRIFQLFILLTMFFCSLVLAQDKPVILGPVIQGGTFEPKRKSVDILVHDMNIRHREVIEGDTKYMVKFV